MSDRYKPLARRLLLAAVAVLFTLLLAEVAVRLFALIAERRGQAAWERVKSARTLEPGAEVGLGQSIRISANPRVIYEMLPNLDVTFRGRPLRTDARGFRVMPFENPGHRPEVRLVGLGDSFMFGWDVEASESYLYRLAGRLNREDPARAWRVINTAVPGYNTVMEVEAFKEKALELDPQVVLVHFVVNDLELPNFLVRHTPVFSLRHLFLSDYLAKGFRYRHHGASRLERAPDHLRDAAQQHLAEVPPAYRDMVGPGPWRRAMDELKQLADAHGFRLYVLADLRAPPFVRAFCEERKMPLIETKDAVLYYLRAHPPNDYEHSALVQSPQDMHPSALGHQLITEVLLARWRADGLLAISSPP